MLERVPVGVFSYTPNALPLLNSYRYAYIVAVAKPFEYSSKRSSRIVYIGKFDQRWPRAHVPFSSMGWMIDTYIPERAAAHVGEPVDLSLVNPREAEPEDCEGALLNRFREMYGRLPIGNSKGGSPGAARRLAAHGITEDDLTAVLMQME